MNETTLHRHVTSPTAALTELARAREYTTVSRLALVAVGGALAVIAAVHLFTLLRTPPVAIDEAWNANRAWGFLHTGRAFGTLDQGVFQKFDGYWTYFPWAAAFIHACFEAIFGLSLFSIRMASFVFGLVLLVAAYFIGRHVGGTRVGIIAIFVVGLSTSFFYSGHLARHDIIVAAMGFGGIALYLTDNTPMNRFSLKSLLTGALVGFTIDIHPNGIIYWAAIGALYLYAYRWKTFRALRAWTFIAGVAAGVFFFLAMHILPYGSTYFDIARLGSVATRTSPLLSFDLGLWVDSLTLTMYEMSMLLVALMAVGFVALLRRGRQADKQLLIMCGVVIVAFAAVVRNKALHYAIYIEPAAALIVAALMGQAWEWLGKRSILPRASAALVWGTAIAATSLAMLPAFTGKDPMPDYNRTVQAINQIVPPGKSIIGQQTFWLGMVDRPYYSWDQIVYYKQFDPAMTVEDGFAQFKPDYFLYDSALELHFTDDNSDIPEYIWYLHLPKQELESFLARRATLAGTVQSEVYKTIRIYKLDWAGSGAATP
ncbi:MAG: glycosyltransferase family 39 protein [Chloroflexota bacterium]|nr:glycosyltransferase family 39 protein [Chloroflexota bacterium]